MLGACRSRSVAKNVERTTGEPTAANGPAHPFDQRRRDAGREHVGLFRAVARAVATFLLGGLTTAEILAVAIGAVAVMALLWATDTVEPERLISGAGFRAAWILLVLAILRPLTWIPYLLPFLAFRKLFDAAMPGRRELLRNILAHLVAVGLLAGVMWLIVATIQGAGTSILSGLAFATGSGSFETLGTFRGDWTGGRIAFLVGAIVVVRLVLPPLGRDVDLSHEPVLGFARGDRGMFDRYVLLAVGVAAIGTGLIAYLIGRS